MYVHKNCSCVEIVYKNAVLKTAKPQQKKCGFKTADFRAVLKPQKSRAVLMRF